MLRYIHGGDADPWGRHGERMVPKMYRELEMRPGELRVWVSILCGEPQKWRLSLVVSLCNDPKGVVQIPKAINPGCPLPGSHPENPCLSKSGISQPKRVSILFPPGLLNNWVQQLKPGRM